MRYALLVLCLIATACAAPERAATSSQNLDSERLFKGTLADQIAAIQSRDLDGLLETVTQRDSLTLIFPDGTTFYTRQEYVDFHKEWFADDGWTMQIEPISTTFRDNLGIALVRTTYTDAAGPRRAMLALTFSWEDASWRLVFDQNTRIMEP